MKKYLSALLMASLAFGMQQASAETPQKNTVKKAAAKKTATAKPVSAANSEDEKEPDTNGSTVAQYQCELGAKLTIYRNDNDEKHIALRWGKRLHLLTRVDTSTGAFRFENQRYGLVWIGIPIKGILLDAKKGQQLANECKTPAEPVSQAAVTPDEIQKTEIAKNQ
jgi:hypothetical protein